MEIKDVKDWIDNGKKVLSSEKKKELNSYVDKVNETKDKNNIARLGELYYNITDPSFNIEYAKTELIGPLSKRLRNISSSDFKTSLTSFISFSKRICESEDNLTEFRKILKDNNLSQWKEHNTDSRDDINILLQRLIQEQEAERRRQQQQQEEAERRRKEQQEAERIRQQQGKEKRIKRIKRIGKIVLFVIAFIALATFNNYRKDKKEYRKLVAQSEKYVKQQQYQKATESLIKIKQITNNKKMVADANARLDKINYEIEKISKTLREEINTVWESYFIKKDGVISTTLDKNIMKYINKKEMPPIIESISQKTEKLKNATDNQKEYNDNIQRLNILIKYYNAQ